MKKFIASLLVFLLLAAGIGYLLYPTASDQISQARDAEILREYRKKAAAMDAEKEEELFRGAAEYNGKLETVRASDVFSAGIPRNNRDYQNRMNVHSGVIGELIVPKTGTALPVHHTGSDTPATESLVHVEGSSLPTDAPGTSIILAGPGLLKAAGFLGDIGLTDGRMLEDMDRLTPGDLLILNVVDRTMVYRVQEVQLMSPAGLEERDLTPGADQELLTVMVRKKDRRLLIQSARIPLAEARDALDGEDEASFPEAWKNVVLLGCPVLLFGMIVMWLIERIKRHAYLLPGEGRQAARREKKAREKLNTITTETDGGEKK